MVRFEEEASGNISAYDLVVICKSRGVREVVISPGSRNAPLSIHFSEIEGMDTFVIPDERSAGFFALGLSIASGRPVVLLCTSGTAVLNYYPSVAEAYYQNIPLVVISADRPPEYIDEYQGQTIRQRGVLAQHTLDDVQLGAGSTLRDRDHNRRKIQKIIHRALRHKKPVHINIPFYEPLYDPKKSLPLPPRVLVLDPEPIMDASQKEVVRKLWSDCPKKVLLIGQIFHPSVALKAALKKLSERSDTLILCENISNLEGTGVAHIDRFLSGLSKSDRAYLVPDLLITFGGMLVSKKVKSFFREVEPLKHWHISREEEPPDLFFRLNGHINISFEAFPFGIFDEIPSRVSYASRFQKLDRCILERHMDFSRSVPFSDFKVFETVSRYTKRGSYSIHFANSASVRYAQLFDFGCQNWFYANRGTSGIDGCSSTAVGCAVLTEASTLLISGDMAWIYDTNAFWNDHLRSDFRCIVINNGGGGIFRIIPGPDTTGHLESVFETSVKQPDLSKISESFGMEYFFADRENTLRDRLDVFFQKSSAPRILEVRTPRLKNGDVLKEYFEHLQVESV